MDTVWYCIYKKSDFSEIEGNVNVLCILEHLRKGLQKKFALL